MVPAVGLGADLPRPAGQSPHVVEPRVVVEQVLVEDAVDLLLRLEEGLELQQQRLAVEGLAQEFPGARAVGFEPLGPAGGPGGGDDDGDGGAEPGILAQRPADLGPVHVGHLGVEDDQVGLGGACPLKRLLAGIGPQHGEAVGRQDALQRPGGPLLVVRDQNERRTCAPVSFCHLMGPGWGIGPGPDSGRPCERHDCRHNTRITPARNMQSRLNIIRYCSS